MSLWQVLGLGVGAERRDVTNANEEKHKQCKRKYKKTCGQHLDHAGKWQAVGERKDGKHVRGEQRQPWGDRVRGFCLCASLESICGGTTSWMAGSRPSLKARRNHPTCACSSTQQLLPCGSPTTRILGFNRINSSLSHTHTSTSHNTHNRNHVAQAPWIHGSRSCGRRRLLPLQCWGRP